jgi:hypothetical protein
LKLSGKNFSIYLRRVESPGISGFLPDFTEAFLPRISVDTVDFKGGDDYYRTGKGHADVPAPQSRRCIGRTARQSVHRLIGSASYGEKLLTSLRDRRLLRTCYKDQLRGHRLTAKAKSLLLADNHSRFSFYLTGNTDTNLIKSEVTRRLRLHRIAETTVTMKNAGVHFSGWKAGCFLSGGMQPYTAAYSRTCSLLQLS